MLVRPDEGTAFVAGGDVLRDPARVRRSIGLAGQFAAVDGHLTAQENLEMVGRLNHLKRLEAKDRASEVIERFGLGDVADRPARTYSGAFGGSMWRRAWNVGPERARPDIPYSSV
jgi:ABC-2 type transport system ATP-binding protein